MADPEVATAYAKLRQVAIAPGTQMNLGRYVPLSAAEQILREAIGEAEGERDALVADMEAMRRGDWTAVKASSVIDDLRAELAAEREAHRKAIEGLRAAIEETLNERHHWCTEGQVVDSQFTTDGSCYLKCSCGKNRRDARLRDALAALPPPPTPGEREPTHEHTCPRCGSHACACDEHFIRCADCGFSNDPAATEPVPNPTQQPTGDQP